MGKKFDSPVDNWKGSVVFADPMSIPQALAWEEGIENAIEHRKNLAREDGSLNLSAFTRFEKEMEPAILACIEDWTIEGLPLPIIPASPRAKSIEFFNWLFMSIDGIYSGNSDIPNA